MAKYDVLVTIPEGSKAIVGEIENTQFTMRVVAPSLELAQAKANRIANSVSQKLFDTPTVSVTVTEVQ